MKVYFKNQSIVMRVSGARVPPADILFTTGAKTTGIDAGVSPTISITDDYLYVCVKGGEAGEAIWKKSLLFQSI
jgi:hypothetical protein